MKDPVKSELAKAMREIADALDKTLEVPAAKLGFGTPLKYNASPTTLLHDVFERAMAKKEAMIESLLTLFIMQNDIHDASEVELVETVDGFDGVSHYWVKRRANPVPKSDFKVWFCTNFRGPRAANIYTNPMALVIAEDEWHAAKLMNEQLKKMNYVADINPGDMHMVLPIGKEEVFIIYDGQY